MHFGSHNLHFFTLQRIIISLACLCACVLTQVLVTLSLAQKTRDWHWGVLQSQPTMVQGQQRVARCCQSQAATGHLLGTRATHTEITVVALWRFEIFTVFQLFVQVVAAVGVATVGVGVGGGGGSNGDVGGDSCVCSD